MNRPIVKYVVRVVLLASTVAALACSNSTAPTAVNAKNASLKDVDPATCLSGYTVIDGLVVCNNPG